MFKGSAELVERKTAGIWQNVSLHLRSISYFIANCVWGILAIGLSLFCFAKFLNGQITTTVVVKPVETFQLPVVTICPDPFWKKGSVDETDGKNAWMVNLTSDSLTEPLVGVKIVTEDNKETEIPLELEKDIGLNFLKTSGKWTSNIFFEDLPPQYWLCYTMHDTEQYDRGVTVVLQLTRWNVDPNMTWNIYLTSGTELLSSIIYHQSDISTASINVKRLELDHYRVDFKLEEHHLLNTDNVPCDSATNYTYSKCMDDCLKHQFVSGEIYDESHWTRCQIIGFQDVEGLEPCRDIEEAAAVRH